MQLVALNLFHAALPWLQRGLWPSMDDSWKRMFVLALPWTEKVLRPVIVYLFLLLGLRLAGKRELAQLNPADLVVLLMLSNTVQNAIIGEDNSVTGGIIGASALLLVNYVFVRALRHNKRLSRLLEGRPDVLVRDGVIQRERLEQELITKAELTVAAHKQGIGSLRDVEKCVLEPTGTITFIERKPTQDTSRHEELVGMLGKLMEEVSVLRGMQPAAVPVRAGHGDDAAPKG